jgi:putative two-component system response regulator
MAGRVTALADVFDALVSDRPYKDAWDFDRAVRYVQEESGRKFDPDVVRVFVENIDEIHYIYETITDSDGLSVHSTEV